MGDLSGDTRGLEEGRNDVATQQEADPQSNSARDCHDSHGNPNRATTLCEGLCGNFGSPLGDLTAQVLQQLGRFAVDAAHRHVSHGRVESRVVEMLEAISIAAGHFALRGDKQIKLSIEGGVAEPSLERLRAFRDRLFLQQEGVPMLFKQRTVRSTQNRVLPFLHLRFEVAGHRGNGTLISDMLHDLRLESIERMAHHEEPRGARNQRQHERKSEEQRDLEFEFHLQLSSLDSARGFDGNEQEIGTCTNTVSQMPAKTQGVHTVAHCRKHFSQHDAVNLRDLGSNNSQSGTVIRPFGLASCYPSVTN